MCDLPELLVCACRLRRELSAAVGQCSLKGQKAVVSGWFKGAYIARWKAIQSRNQILGHGGWLQDLQGGAISGGGSL